MIRDWIGSPNASSRGGSDVTHIVLHTAQGATTYQSLGNFFSSPSAEVSSHVGIDDSPGVIGEYVARTDKAWTAANANPFSVQAELCAWAEWDRAEWDRHPTMIENTARWVAEEAALYNIPIIGLSEHEAQNPNSRGVCQHADLGSMGGGHWDCGGDFPFDQILSMASGGIYVPGPDPGPTPPPSGGGDAPGFPLPGGSYFGPEGGGSESVSGYHSHRGDLAQWQGQMINRGWNLGPAGADGLYGSPGDTDPSQSMTGSVALAFQLEKGLAADGLIGPETWRTAWTAPIT